jgi:NAD(P)-dependent dehydrogenase (short-subunit alcohol dehydrogenase family)
MIGENQHNPFNIDVKDRVAVVTGGSSGIGLAISKAFLLSGAFVINWDISENQSTEDLLRKFKGRFMTVITDISNEIEVKFATKKTVEEFSSIDIVVNNAGIMVKGAIDDLDLESWDRIYNINVKGTLLVAQNLIPYLKKSTRGRIINVSSMTSAIGMETYSPYSSSKAAVSNLTKVWALELAPYGITVNALCPGWVDTPMLEGLIDKISEIHYISKDQAKEKILRSIPQKRFIPPEELAFSVLFLSSPLCQGISGSDFFIDNGLTHTFIPGFHMAQN